ncbi:hypothetical protein GB937_009314 [Aspergillus fischeri]|nr:hypothetical protein GB937_009314 [Aspergillus fischeri]
MSRAVGADVVPEGKRAEAFFHLASTTLLLETFAPAIGSVLMDTEVYASLLAGPPSAVYVARGDCHASKGDRASSGTDWHGHRPRSRIPCHATLSPATSTPSMTLLPDPCLLLTAVLARETLGLSREL